LAMSISAGSAMTTGWGTWGRSATLAIPR
jgi:hypothetical protein